MLDFLLLKNHGGILLTGDYGSLRELQETVYAVNDASPIIRDKEGSFLALAYDARKAIEGQRTVIKAPPLYPELGVRYGVEVIWPVLLFQSRMLRSSLAYFNSSKLHQAIAYNLEHVIERAIKDDFGSDAERIIELWEAIDPAHPYPEQKLNSRGAIFCSWSKTQRKAKLAGLLLSFNPSYNFIYSQQLVAGAKDLVSPEILDSFDNVEWVDPKCSLDS